MVFFCTGVYNGSGHLWNNAMDIHLGLVHIQWNDASEGDELDDVDSNECLQESVGFIAKETKQNYFIARDYDHLNKAYARVIRIPKKYVLKLKELR